MKARIAICFVFATIVTLTFATSISVDGIRALVARRLPDHVGSFVFEITDVSSTTTSNRSITSQPNDEFTVSNGPNCTIKICGNSASALAYGLRWYLTNVAHVDIWWFVGSRLHLAPSPLPTLGSTYTGNSIVPWRYHFNTVTFSYTTAFWTWEDWEVQLDWMALHGINLPLAWVGFEKILVDVFLEFGFAQTDIDTFLSGPAFQAWNRFGNIQGSWGGNLAQSWLDDQFNLNRKIVSRVAELGMTPVLPCFTGSVPMAITNIYPNASVVNGSQWNSFPRQYTNVSFLEPFDPLFSQMQTSFISKQRAAYGNVSHIYTLDQYNENDPFSGDLAYLHNITKNTYASLAAADSEAVWLIQGWLFFSSESFWTDERIEAYLGGVDNDKMLILDLFSESEPQWQRTNNYYGKPWIWCMLHDYGQNMGLYGQIENVTGNPIEALANKSSTMVGMGLTMEGQEGNEIVYDLLLDQAWSSVPIDTEHYFRDWVTSRYGPRIHSSQGLYQAWDIMRTTVYNNTNLTAATAVTKSILELAPNITGLVNRTGHHPTSVTYQTSILIKAWRDFYGAALDDPTLWSNAVYCLDLTDITRQVMANEFIKLYEDFVSALKSIHDNQTTARIEPDHSGDKILALLQDLDTILSVPDSTQFSLPIWISSARAFASQTDSSGPQGAKLYEYDARNQITLWGPTGQINDYASKQWAGLVGTYYLDRWKLFIEFSLNSTTTVAGVNTGLNQALMSLGEAWDLETWSKTEDLPLVSATMESPARVFSELLSKWPNLFS